MRVRRRLRPVPVVVLSMMILAGAFRPASGEAKLETALGNLYGICLFEEDATNPFSNAARLSRASLAPGITGFIESNLAAIPLAPPRVNSIFRGGEVVDVISGFTPVYTEGTATVGQGKVFMGTNVSFYSFSKLRGQELSETTFRFAQNDLSGDYVLVNMPMKVKASVFSFYGTYGITNRFDIGVVLPIVNLDIQADGTTFQVVRTANDSGCGYSPAGALCDYNPQASTTTPPLGLDAEAITGVNSLSSTFLSTLAVRLKYRLPVSGPGGGLSALLDLRIPTRGKGNVLGRGDFGTRVTLVAEARTRYGFTPYVNLGAQAWDGKASSSLNVAAGFTQLFYDRLAFSFDVLGKLDIENNPFLQQIDAAAATSGVSPVTGSTIPSVNKDHQLNSAIGLQYAFNPDFQAYGSVLFSLLDRGLNANIVPTVGLSVHL